VENLAALNNAIDHGLWGGRVIVFEAGAEGAANSTIFKNYPGISGAIIDFYLATEATVFIGTAVSSFSNDVWTTLLYEDRMRKN